MVNAQIRDNIIKDLDKLPVDLQKKVQDFVQALIVTLPKGVPGKLFSQHAGKLSKEDASEIMRVIDEGCEKVDLHEW